MGRRAQQHWYGLYRELEPQLAAYQGQESLNVLISALSKQANYEATVVSRMLKAGKFLDQIAGPCSVEQVQCGYAHIELLERLHQIAPVAAQALVQVTLSKQQTLQELRETIGRYSTAAGAPSASMHSQSRSRVLEHERHCANVLESTGPELFGYPDGELIKVTSSDFFSQFFMIRQEKTPKVAIFPRVGDTSRKVQKAAAELLKLASLAHGYFEQVWLIFPQDLPLVHELAFYAHTVQEFKGWLKLGTLHADDVSIHPFQNLERSLELQLDGADALRWDGIVLADKQAVHGSFEKPKPLPE